MRARDHLDLEAEAHAGLLEVGAEGAVDQADGREVLHAREAEADQALQELVGDHERIGAVDAGEHRRVLDHRQHLVRHLADDLVGVAVGEQAGERAAPGHAVAARVVDDDEVDAAGLLALGRQARAGAAADQRPAGGDLGAEALEQRLSSDAGHGERSSVGALRRATATSRQAATSASANASSLMCMRQAHELAVGAGAEALLDRGEERAVGLRIVERLARPVDRRDAAFGNEEAHRPASSR